MSIEQLPVEVTELAWHDWGRTLKIRKPSAVGKNSGAFAFDKGKDAWHPEAFVGTGVEHLLPPDPSPRQVVFNAIDWCGNVIGQVEDCPYGPVGRVYDVKGLGLVAGYKLANYGLEMLPDGTWVWGLYFTYDKDATHTLTQAMNAAYESR